MRNADCGFKKTQGIRETGGKGEKSEKGKIDFGVQLLSLFFLTPDT
jgi:hypothetical protein